MITKRGPVLGGRWGTVAGGEGPARNLQIVYISHHEPMRNQFTRAKPFASLNKCRFTQRTKNRLQFQIRDVSDLCSSIQPLKGNRVACFFMNKQSKNKYLHRTNR